MKHIDDSWITEKINGNSGGYSYNKPSGMVIIHWIYGRNHMQLFYYNMILLVKYLFRKVGITQSNKKGDVNGR